MEAEMVMCKDFFGVREVIFINTKITHNETTYSLQHCYDLEIPIGLAFDKTYKQIERAMRRLCNEQT